MGTQDITLGSYRLKIDTTSGLLVGLALGKGPDALGHGGGPTLPGAILAYQPLQAQPVYRDHMVDDGTLTVELTLGPLVMRDRYRVAGALIDRCVTVENASQEEVQLTGLRIGLRGAAVGRPEDCRFEAPANVVRPRLPLSAASSQKNTPDLHFAPGMHHRWGAAFGNAPDVGPGLMVVHNPKINWSLLTWYVSQVEAARPWVSGDGIHATLGFDLYLAGWMPPEDTLVGGTQYVMLHQGDYRSALSVYRGTFDHTSITPPIYRKIDRALDWSGVYEVHPGQFGGFERFREALPGIKELGIDTIYLLPVMAHRNKRGLPWDENWEAIGSPYAMHDFEAFEPSLGTEAEFIELVQAAHNLGLRVLMDFVAQGCSLEARYVAEHPEWFARDEQGCMVHSHGWNDTWSFDWANPDYQAYMVGWAARFVKEYSIDGFRVDAPHGKEPNWDRRVPYHASATNLGAQRLLENLRCELLQIKPEAVLYCELFGPLWVRSHDIANDYHPYAMVLQLFEGRLTPHEFNEYLRDYWAVMPRSPEGYPSPRICFTETHDTRSWPAYALRGSAVEQALLGILVMGGFVPMIWSGQEVGQETFIRGLMLARRNSWTLRRGHFLFNEVTIDDEAHYRRDQGMQPSEAVYSVVRYYEDAVLFGVASLFPEQVTFRFGLPLDRLPIRHVARYRLHDLISDTLWNEYGKTVWTGTELASFHLTPRMYRPYIFCVEEMED